MSKLKRIEKQFSSMTIERLNNGYLVGMLDDNTQRAVELKDSYVFESLSGAIKFIEKHAKELVPEKEIKDNREDYF